MSTAATVEDVQLSTSTLLEMRECRYHLGYYDPKHSDAADPEKFCSQTCAGLYAWLCT